MSWQGYWIEELQRESSPLMLQDRRCLVAVQNFASQEMNQKMELKWGLVNYASSEKNNLEE